MRAGRFTNPGPVPRRVAAGPILERCHRVRNRTELAAALPADPAAHEAFARGVGLRAGGAVATPFATPREAPWLRALREGTLGTRSPRSVGIDPEVGPFRLFYSAGLQSDLSDLPPGVTAIGVDLMLASGAVERDQDGRIVGVVRDGSPLAKLADKLHDRPANLFLDNGAFRKRGKAPLTEADSQVYLERAEGLMAELERGGCCTLLLVAPDAVGNPEATVALRTNRDVMGGYWHLASRGAYVMFPIQTGDDQEVEAQLEQLGEQMDALAPTWEPYAIQGRVVVGIPSSAAAVDPDTVRKIAWRAAQLGDGWAETPVSWFHLLGTSRSRKQRGAWTVGDLAVPIEEVYEWLSESEEFAVPTRPIVTSDSTRAVTKATGMGGRASRREVIAEEALAGLRSGTTSAGVRQMALFNPGEDPELEALLAEIDQARRDRQPLRVKIKKEGRWFTMPPPLGREWYLDGRHRDVPRYASVKEAEAHALNFLNAVEWAEEAAVFRGRRIIWRMDRAQWEAEWEARKAEYLARR